MCSWSKIGAGGKDKEEHRAQVGTRGGDKARFTAQLSIAKDGTKMQSCTMLKDAAFDGTREHRENLVHELKNLLCDAHENKHPPEDRTCLT